jgi:lipopolysaccharide transport system permease protein
VGDALIGCHFIFTKEEGTVKAYSVRGGFMEMIRQRQLLKNLVTREIQSRYRGTVLGFAWLIVYPVLMMGVYSFVFGGVFKSRWMNQGSMGEFVIMLFCGLIVFTIFSEVANRAPSMIIGNPNYVKKVVFPLELLPLVSLGAAVFNALISFAILCLLILIVNFDIPGTAAIAPLILLPLLLMTAGVSWGLAALGVFFRDLSQMVGIVTSMMLFLSPVFFAVSSAPEAARWLLNFNPLTYPIEEMRHVLIMGQYPNWGHLGMYLVSAMAVAWAGLWVFQRSRPAFADVL